MLSHENRRSIPERCGIMYQLFFIPPKIGQFSIINIYLNLYFIVKWYNEGRSVIYYMIGFMVLYQIVKKMKNDYEEKSMN